MKTVLAALLCLCVASVQVAAQGDARAGSAGNAALDNIESLIARSRFRDAAAALDAWENAHPRGAAERGRKAEQVSAADRAHAMMLRARLTQSADSVRTIYVDLASSYPASAEAPIALLRLAQLAVAEDDTLRAISYLQRIARDYPGSDANRDAAEWRARVMPPAAQQKTASPSKTASAQKTASASKTASAPKTASPSKNTSAPARDSAFALQVGAFKEASTAATVSRQLGKRGFDARVVLVPGSTLSRVRVGRFVSSRATDALLRRLRSAGYDAVIVDDAMKETHPPK
jgi:cell division septation protein DedD